MWQLLILVVVILVCVVHRASNVFSVINDTPSKHFRWSFSITMSLATECVCPCKYAGICLSDCCQMWLFRVSLFTKSSFEIMELFSAQFFARHAFSLQLLRDIYNFPSFYLREIIWLESDNLMGLCSPDAHRTALGLPWWDELSERLPIGPGSPEWPGLPSPLFPLSPFAPVSPGKSINQSINVFIWSRGTVYIHED